MGKTNYQSFKTKLAILGLGLFLTSCGQAPQMPAFVPGPEGPAGPQGAPGTSSIIKILDPCGPTANEVDEVVLVFEDGSILAWYKDIGFSVLEEGVTYQTTDSQKCRFSVLSGDLVY